ncbi:MAG: hypothetical protein PHQ60_08360 [Sideroxydans sp.]|nr:hypothetical protein [Sideroxydans sp.]
MKAVICLIAFITGVASMALQAAENDNAPTLIYVGTVGVSNGGDTLYSAYDDAGWRSNLRAGAFLQLGVGVLLQPPAAPVTLQLTFNWQNDAFNYNYFYKSNVSNGFNRFPIELMGYYTPMQDFRIGVGKRFVKSPSAYVKVNNSMEELSFDNTIGKVLEIGYQFGHGANEGWINLRYVSEHYQPDMLIQNGMPVSVAGSPVINGSHIGINVVMNLEPAFKSSGSSSASNSIREQLQQPTYQAVSPYVAHEHHIEKVEREVVLIVNKPDGKPPAKPDDDKIREY